MSDVLQGAEDARNELVRMDGVIFVRVSLLDGTRHYKGGTNDPEYAGALMRLNDAIESATNIRRMAGKDLDVRLSSSKIRIVTEQWRNMIVSVAINTGHPSNKSLKRKFRRVAKKFDPGVQSPGASASAAPSAAAFEPGPATIH